jgi:hypothetical protein
MRQKIDKITRQAPSATGRHATANENRPAQNPSAREMIAEAESARATVDAARDEAAVGEEAGEGEAGDKTPTGDPLPTMEELELARDDHSRKIVGREADGED